MAQDLEYRIIISADGRTAINQIERTEAGLRDVSDAGRAAVAGVDSLTNTLLQLNLGERILSSLVDRIGEVAQAADNWNNLQSRIALVIDGSEAAAAAMEDVRRVADATSTDIGSTGDLYATLARALKSLGDETTNTADLTQTIGQALALSGRGATENASAIQQLSQALASGVLRGDEFNSMMENGPRLMQALADGLGTTTGKLRAMAEAGTLTADIVIAALTDQSAVINAEFSQLPDTIGRATTRLSNAFKALVGDTDDVTLASTQVAAAIGLVANNLDGIATVAAAGGMAAMAAGAVKAADSMRGLAAATLAARIARAEQAVAEQTALATAAESAAMNARVALSFSERSSAAVASARAELAAAEQAAVAARQQLSDLAELSIFGERRALAERDLTAALLARTAAEERVTVATQVATGAQVAATTAATQAAAAQTAAAATSGVWARAAGTLGSALGLLKSPMNALMGAATAIIGYQVGGALREWGVEALYAGEQGSFAAAAFERLATAAEAATIHLQEIDAKIADKLKAISTETGLAFSSMEDFNHAAEMGAVVFDKASQSWQKGAVSLEIARSAVTKLDAALQTQLAAIEAVAAREAESAKLSEQRRDLSLQLAAAIGDEATALAATAEARAAGVAQTERAEELSTAALANAHARLTAMIAEAKAGEGLTSAKQAQIVALTEEVEKQQRAVAASQLATEAARIAQVQAKLAAETYGDQSDQIGALTDHLQAAQTALGAIEAAQRAGKAAAVELAAAQAALATATEAYRAKMSEAATGNADVSASLADLGQKQQAAQAVVDALTAKVAAGTAADKQAQGAKEAVAIALKKVADAAGDLTKKRELEVAQTERLTNAIGEEGDLRVTHLRNLAKEAAARGDVVAAAGYQRQAMQAEIETLQQLLVAKQAEAAAAQAAVAAKIAEAQLVGGIDQAEQAAIATSQAAADAKSREAEAIQEAIRAKKAEVEATKNSATAAKSVGAASDGAADSVDRLSDRQSENAKITRSWSQMMLGAGIDLKALGEYAKTAEEAFAQAYTALWAENMSGRRNFGSFENYVAALRNIEERSKSAALAAADHARQLDLLNGRMEALNGQYERGDIGLGQYIAGLERAANGTTRLGEEDLQELRNALSDARQEMNDFAGSAQEGLRDLQAEWADYRGEIVEAMKLEQEGQRLEVEMALIEAKKNGNAEEIAFLTQKLALLKEYQAAQLAAAAEEEAANRVKAAEDAAAEAARRASLTAEERAYEDLIASLKDQLADAILANNDALEASILAQIEAEKRRHAEYLKNLEIEKKARDDANQSSSSNSSATPNAASGGTGSVGATQPVKTVTVNINTPSGQSGTINVLPGDEDTLIALLRALETGKAVAH